MTAPRAVASLPVPLRRDVAPSAVLTVFRLMIDRLIRGRRLLVLGVLFSMPAAIALLQRVYVDDGPPVGTIEEALVLLLIPQAMLPLTALVFASGLLQDEVEEQTLTYLLIRPIPRWLIYVAKLAGVVLVTAALTAVFTSLTLAVIWWDRPGFWPDVIPIRAAQLSGLFALGALTYGSLFGCLSLIFRRVLVVGIGYVIVFEGVLANIDFVVRKATIMYHLRVLAARWLALDVDEWRLDLEQAPLALTSLLVLLGISLAATALACVLISTREFRLKTPEST
jgi:ABC-2 type transport system permease protein